MHALRGFVVPDAREVNAMGDEDTLILTPEEKEEILKELPEEAASEDSEDED